MSVLLRVLILLGALILMCFVLKRIRTSKMKIECSVFWIIFSAVLVVIGVFPQLVYFIADLIGFYSSVSMVFLVINAILIVKVFLMTIQISQLENKIDSLVQQIAIANKKNEE